MSTNAAIGHGSAFKRSSDGTSGGSMVAVAGVTGISGPGLARDTIDVTDMDSTERWREFIGGLKDGGEVTIECEFDPNGTDVTNWLADINTDTDGYYQVVFPDTTAWGFDGFMTALDVDDPHDDKMSCSATYKLSGKPAFIA
ncbi:MAG TPA: outer capsid protein Hoc [Gammaproteobacteria bacterium]|nr:outer capsid protein Hoc [Gammaproteobacteria bacterium]